MPPLTGLRIFDMTRVMAGPFCTALLADLGAEVIKLEPPAGDDYRHIGPFVQGQSALFTLMNRGKQSIVMDLKDPAAVGQARSIALGCDVVVENFRPGVAARLGLGPELRDVCPSLIYASISGFGQTGPSAHLPAYDLVAQAMSGLMAATGEAGGPPLKVGESYGDLMAGLYAAWGIMAALYQRGQTGQGATLDVAMFDALFSLLPTSHAVQFYAGRVPQRVGNRHPLSTPFGCYTCADGQVVVAQCGTRFEFAIKTRGASLWVRTMATGRPDCTIRVSSASRSRRLAQMRSKSSHVRAARPMPPYTTNSCGFSATSGCKLFINIRKGASVNHDFAVISVPVAG
jgi:CoA:oxalate CoA-transferase